MDAKQTSGSSLGRIVLLGLALTLSLGLLRYIGHSPAERALGVDATSVQDRAQARWEQAIDAWAARHPAFFARPDAIKVFQSAVDQVAAEARAPLSDEELIELAGARALASLTDLVPAPVPEGVGGPPLPPGFRLATPSTATSASTAPPPAPPIVKRGIFGGCPTGYVDHPSNPEQCALPWAADRMMRGGRRQRD
jgi:hypothetical protein